MEIFEQADEQSRNAQFSLPKQHRGNRMRQFRLDFYDEHHYFKGGDHEAYQFWRSHQSQFEAYVIVRVKARVARKAAVNARRREKKRVEQAAAAAAKVLRHEREVARFDSAAALAHSSKAEKAGFAIKVATIASPRSDAAHAALQEERRIRHKAKRVVAGIRKQARRVAATVVLQAVQGVHRVSARVVSGGVATERVVSQIPSPLSNAHPLRLSRLKHMTSKFMPRRKRSARKSG